MTFTMILFHENLKLLLFGKEIVDPNVEILITILLNFV